MSDKYEEALRKLVKEEVITAPTLRRITGLDIDEASDEMRKAVGLLHTMLCEQCGRDCKFINEEQFQNPWAAESHTIWLRRAFDMAGQYDLDDKDLLNAVTAATSGLQNVSTFSSPALNILMRFIRVHLRQAHKAATAPERKDDQASGLQEGSADQGLD